MQDQGGPTPDDPPDEDRSKGDASPLPEGEGPPGGEEDAPGVAPSARRGPRTLLRDLWPLALLLAVSAAALVLAAARDAIPSPQEVGAPADAPGGAAASPAPTEAMVGLAQLVLLAAGAATLLLLLVARVRRWLLPPPRRAPRATWGTEHLLVGMLLAFMIASLFALALGAPGGASVIGGALGGAGMQAAVAAVVVALVVTRPRMFPHLFMVAGGGRGPGAAPERLASLGISARDAGANALRGLVGAVAALPLAFLAGWLGESILRLAGGEAVDHPVIRQLRSATPAETAVLVAVACVGVPLFEEIFFRGFLYASVRDRLGVVAGALASSLVFAAVHPGLPNQMATFVLGVAFCLVYERAGTLVAPVVAHALFNAIQLAFVLAARAPG